VYEPREARMDIDLVKDEVEACLDREIEVIRYQLPELN
jgi:hypothetical protein